MGYIKSQFIAWVAQWIEQKFPKLLVGGSIPLPGTIPKAVAHRVAAFVFLLVVLLKFYINNSYRYKDSPNPISRLNYAFW
jgi:hypothetical protein